MTSHVCAKTESAIAFVSDTNPPPFTVLSSDNFFQGAMDLAFRASTTGDAEEICDVFFDAFAQHAIVQRIFVAGSQSARQHWLRGVDNAMQDPGTHFIVVTDPSSPTPGRIIAFAQWLAPITKSRDDKPGPAPAYTWPEGADTAFAEVFYDTAGRKHDELMADRPHWYLRTIGVRTEAQGKGIGGRLIKWGLDRADAAGLEVYLGASPAGAPVYMRYGFENTETVEFEGGQSHVFMVRKPLVAESG